MTTDFRAALQELHDAVHEQFFGNDTDLPPQLIKATNDAGRLLCAEPEPEGPSDEELEQWYKDCADETTLGAADHYWAFEVPVDYANDLARAVLARFGGRPGPQLPAAGEVAELVAWLRENAMDEREISEAENRASLNLDRAANLLERLIPPQPVPVSERLPGPGDCDAEGECYWFDPEGSGAWYQDTYQGNYTHWLPAHALPLPN